MADNYVVLGGICAAWCIVSISYMFTMVEIKQKEISILEDIRAGVSKSVDRGNRE